MYICIHNYVQIHLNSVNLYIVQTYIKRHNNLNLNRNY